MARTTFATGNALAKKLFEEKLFRDTIKETYWMPRFASKTGDTAIHTKQQFNKSKGDNITFGIRMRLTGTPRREGEGIEGYEQSLTTHDFSISLGFYAFAIRDDGPLSRQRVMFEMDEESQMAIRDQGAEYIDSLCFDTLEASPTRLFYRTSAGNLTTATDATAKGAITAADSKITPSLISFAKTWALTGGNRAQTPLRPIKVKGRNYIVLMCHPDVIYDLRQDSEWSQAAREALPPGTDHPIFNGAEYLWDGVVIHSHENAEIYTNGGSGSNIPGAKLSMFGAQCLCWAWGSRPEVVAEEFEYKTEHGYAWMFMGAVGKTQFNSLDYGVVHMHVARTQVSDA